MLPSEDEFAMVSDDVGKQEGRRRKALDDFTDDEVHEQLRRSLALRPSCCTALGVHVEDRPTRRHRVRTRRKV